MKSHPITFKPIGPKAVLISWPNNVNEEILNDIIEYRVVLEKEFGSGFEYVPSYSSLAIISNTEDFDLNNLEEKLKRLYKERATDLNRKKTLWELPVCYDLEFGIDLNEVASNLKVTIPELIKMHSSYEYTVYCIGFLPGFMYLGGLPGNMETKRKESPRLKVVKGAVGLASKQTGIYPQESPGGWNIIGNCPVSMFNVKANEPCFVSVGDKIKFMPITTAEYKLHKIESEVGIYKPKKILLDG